MEFRVLAIFALLCVSAKHFMIALKGSNASLPAGEVYWNSILPKALRDLLQPDEEIKVTFSYVEDASLLQAPRTSYNLGYWSETKEFDKDAITNTTTIYFLYDDLLPHKKMRLIFPKSMNVSNFWPRKIVKSIPFSSKKLPEIFKYFSIKPTSKEAQVMKRTLFECEAPGIRGEDKYCAISLESLVDFVVAKFGNKVQVFFNEAEEENKKQEYTILKGIKMIGDNQIVCHKEIYAFAVFYCHTVNNTKAYMVPFEGADGSKAKAAIICHLDTSDWNPQHFAFHVLNVKPGGPPVCHFLNSDTIVWVPK